MLQPPLPRGHAFFCVGEPEKRIDVNMFDCPSGHLNESLLRKAAKPQDVTLTGTLQPCEGCLEAKGVRAGVLRRTTSRAERPMETVHIDLAGPYEASMGEWIYLIMFVYSASRWTRLYGMKNKSETTAFVKKFVADTNDMGPPKCFRSDNGGEFTSNNHVNYWDSVGIRREYTAVGKP